MSSQVPVYYLMIQEVLICMWN